MSDPASITRLATELQADHGHLDVLINNAAVDYDTDALASTADLSRVRKAFDTNLFGAWQVTLALLPLLRGSAHPRIVNVSSEAGSISELGAGTPGYSTSKAALNALTRILAAELRAENFLVNAVCPGWVATDMGGPGGGPVTAGAASVAWAVRLADGGPTGGFYRHGQPLPW
ncbi:SDR family NAD(P)-dependent oxidoreductase [Crossiella cryophila]|uniref:NAD(P)-dependent dehydrogenase (Short-subunit alcohol dehydrogenase family) n=1 Tax=Crossiella cryophila TaxID=43355 RepID=A0A7W7CC38_9PSEU|nr:SDR family NAD(P)-dependent oxidoreductase [Crossiella cryophila]MBB4676819.1 NAD(P)-dependent dehydrogenase (short-subunit alcohol dehydrogenase family) [Crossiella cryophila]